jgi:S1-C subfamily serine protease
MKRALGVLGSIGLALWLSIAGACAASAAQSAASGASGASGPIISIDAADLRAKTEALARANAAVVGVRALAVDDARSIATLGRTRQGSGVVIGDDGLVATIGYLVLEADSVELIVEGRRVLPARVVAYDLASGFGLLLPLAPLRLPPARLGNSSALEIDEPLMVASGGEDGELSIARMVARRPFSGYWEYHIENAIFTTPPRTDHSGAGLFNANGELLGIGSLVVTDTLGPKQPRVPGNMFVPVDLLKAILPELRARGATRASTRAWLGLNCTEDDGGVAVVRVTPDGPGEEAGLRPGDRLLRIDDVSVGTLEAMYKALWQGGAERDIRLQIRRGDAEQILRVRTQDRMKTLKRAQGI